MERRGDGSNAGGFDFEFVKRNAMLAAKGVKPPTATKTGTTIAGVIYKVRWHLRVCNCGVGLYAERAHGGRAEKGGGACPALLAAMVVKLPTAMKTAGTIVGVICKVGGLLWVCCCSTELAGCRRPTPNWLMGMTACTSQQQIQARCLHSASLAAMYVFAHEPPHCR